MKPIRNSARAIIMDGSKVLLTKNKDYLGDFYMFPGGGQEKGEPLSATVYRECLEEAGVKVVPGNMLCIREYIGRNHEFAEWDSDFHQVEFYFLCRIINDECVQLPLNPDHDQIGIEWLELRQLKNVRIYPKIVAHRLAENGPDRLGDIYFGDVN